MTQYRLIIFAGFLSIVSGTYSYARNPADIDQIKQLVSEQFLAFQQKLTDCNEVPAVTVFTTYAQATGDKWTLIIDCYGNRIFRPVSLYNHMNPLLKEKGQQASQITQVHEVIIKKLLERTSSFARQFTQNDMGWHTITTMKKEVLLQSECPKTVSFHNGRYFIRLSSPDRTSYFQMLFTPAGKPLRVDTNILNSSISRLKDLLISYNSETPPPNSTTDPIVMGTFYDPEELRFVFEASNYFSKDFLDPATKDNPFHRNGPVFWFGTQKYFECEEQKHWCWYWWNLYGRVNGIRGNWNPSHNSWDFPNMSVAFNNNLADYGYKNADILERKEHKLDGITYTHPFGISKTLENRFYEDLEGCQVSVICTHGGFIEERMQLRQRYDVWFLLNSDSYKLGSGKLRYLFIHACSTMNCFKEELGQALVREWMPARYINGLNTICGSDGNHDTTERDGWRFFGRYNKLDSISDAWAFASIDESLPNAPATVAYGETQNTAAKSLFEGRFTAQRVDPKYSAGSVWVAIDPSAASDKTKNTAQK
jgi:hypothetical protein